jgi:hypothetical protein
MTTTKAKHSTFLIQIHFQFHFVAWKLLGGMLEACDLN